jgi:hypothetical protein
LQRRTYGEERAEHQDAIRRLRASRAMRHPSRHPARAPELWRLRQASLELLRRYGSRAFERHQDPRRLLGASAAAIPCISLSPRIPQTRSCARVAERAGSREPDARRHIVGDIEDPLDVA